MNTERGTEMNELSVSQHPENVGHLFLLFVSIVDPSQKRKKKMEEEKEASFTVVVGCVVSHGNGSVTTINGACDWSLGLADE